MSVIELHLVINHIPIIGTACSVVLLFIGLLSRNTFVQKIALWFLLVLSMMTVVAYFSGDQSADLISDLSLTARHLLHIHAQLARTALLTMTCIGSCSLLCLLLARFQVFFNYCVRAIFAMTVVCMALFILTGYIGGQVAHEEIRSVVVQNLPVNGVVLMVAGLMALTSLVTAVAMFLHRSVLFTIPTPPISNQRVVADKVETITSQRARR